MPLRRLSIQPSRSTRLRWAAILLCGAIAAQGIQPAHGQQPKQSPKQSDQQERLLRIESELVQIDLVVTDKQGKPVRDLKREDFELFEDGKRQNITHFAAGTASQPARWLATEKRESTSPTRPTTTARPNEKAEKAAEAPDRHIVLAVDDYHLSPANLVYVRRALDKFISEQMAAADRVALIAASGSLGLFQQFTSERPVLQRAINRLSVREKNLENNFNIPRITEHQAELIEFGDRDAMELAIKEIQRYETQDQNPQGGQAGGGASRQGGGGRGGQGQQPTINPNGPSPRETLEYRVRSQARMVLAMNGNYTQATLSTLESAIRNLRQLPGRKILILLSDGFFLSGTGVYSKLMDLRRITDAATRAGVVIYSIDARGLVTVSIGGDATERVELEPSMANAQSRIQLSAVNAKRDGLSALAEATGGTLFYNSNDLNLGLQRVMDANESYYVLAYEPPESRRDGRFHKIEVRVARQSNGADGAELKVRTRGGYLAPDEKAENDARKAEQKRQEQLKNLPPEKLTQELRAERDKQMAAGIGSLFPLRDIPTELAADFVDLATFSGAILNAHISAANLSFDEAKGRRQSVVEIAGYFFDERGKTAASFNERININAQPESFELLLRHGFNYRRLVDLKPGFYQARVAVREEKTGRMGSITAWVEIPDVKNQKLALSGIMLSEAGQGGLQDLKNNAATSQLQGYEPRPSSATRRFKAGGDIDLLLFVYNARAEQNAVDLAVQTQIFSGGKQVFATPLMKIAVAAGSDLQRIPFAARLPIKALSAGQYELRLMAIDRLTKATASGQVNFSIE